MKRVFLIPPTVFSQPKISSIRFRAPRKTSPHPLLGKILPS
jgi:hypothetical protein